MSRVGQVVNLRAGWLPAPGGADCQSARRLTTCPTIAVLFFATVALAAGPPLPVAKPEQVGLSSERLKRIHELVARFQERGDIAGAVTVVARRGKLAHVEAQGFSD